MQAVHEVDAGLSSLKYATLSVTLPDGATFVCRPCIAPSPTPSSMSSLPVLGPSSSSPPSAHIIPPTTPPADTKLTTLSVALDTVPVSLITIGQIGEGAVSEAYLGFLKPDKTHSFVIKTAVPGAEEDLLDEAAVALSPEMQQLKQYVVPSCGIYGGRIDDDDECDRSVMLMEYGGDAAETWLDWNIEERLTLLTGLMHLHAAGVVHGDIRYSNTVGVGVGAGNVRLPPRWIDLSAAETGHNCPGERCRELRAAARSMKLQEERERVRQAAREAGLEWE
ncbi:hypothetical protein JCM10207_007254 [Rhodosporidiobolus poonsookiae]